MTGDEKWCLYANITRKGSWVQSKIGLRPKKAMLCIWWDSQGILHMEFLKNGDIINSEIYCQQLERLNKVIEEKRGKDRKVRFLHDNARPHTAKTTIEKLNSFKWDILLHPCSPDLAPTDYYLFRSLSNTLQRKTFNSDREMEEWMKSFFDEKPAFYL